MRAQGWYFLFAITLLTLLYGFYSRMYCWGVYSFRCMFSIQNKQMKGTYSWYLLGNAIMIVATLLIDAIL